MSILSFEGDRTHAAMQWHPNYWEMMGWQRKFPFLVEASISATLDLAGGSLPVGTRE
jgi:hypothetical protein